MKKLLTIAGAFIFVFGLFTQVLAQEVELIFSHKYHISEIETSCADCHAPAKDSKLSTDNLLPDMETCFTCHDSEGECTLCHKDPDNAVAYPRIEKYIAYFPHALHLQKEQNCEACHPDVAKSENIFDKHLPAMAACTQCHTDLADENYCGQCHASSENLRPTDHKNSLWLTQHGPTSYCESNNCQACHTNRYCLECHQGDNLDRKVHKFNFINNHGLQAKANKMTCLTCHEEQSSCNDCHRQRMVMPRSHAAASWAIPGTGGLHARKAKFDLDSCISCHSDVNGNPVCIMCHQKK